MEQKVLAGHTKGYKNHPQLIRFKKQSNSLKFIGTYLNHIYLEAKRRGYNFNEAKILMKLSASAKSKMSVTSGQVEFEMIHLKKKLKNRSPADLAALKTIIKIRVHPLFIKKPGKVESWEIVGD